MKIAFWKLVLNLPFLLRKSFGLSLIVMSNEILITFSRIWRVYFFIWLIGSVSCKPLSSPALLLSIQDLFAQTLSWILTLTLILKVSGLDIFTRAIWLFFLLRLTSSLTQLMYSRIRYLLGLNTIFELLFINWLWLQIFIFIYIIFIFIHSSFFDKRTSSFINKFLR